MISLLVDVHLCPAVPTAPNKAPRIDISISASFEIIIALLPPSSSNALPNLAPTAAPTAFPILVEPVADNRGILASFAIHSPTSRPPMIKEETPSGTLFFANTSEIICWHAIPHKGVFSDGFHTQTSPQTNASILFQLQTATGKLNAEMIPTIPNGCHCSYMRCPGRSLCM